MNIEEKAKAYDEALALAKRLISNNCTEVEKLCLKCVFPELKESEDERIIEEIKFAVMQMPSERQDTKNRCLAWLEKQKEQKLNPDKKELIRQCVGSILTDATDERFKDYGLTLKDCLTWLDEQEEQKSGELDKIERLMKALQAANAQIGELVEENYKLKEQKPAEKQDYSGLNDLERAIHRGFLVAGVENVSVTLIKETAYDCLAQMKPAEWSEEDEDKLFDIQQIVENFNSTIKYSGGNLMPSKEYKKELIALLKSLRPQPQRIYQQVVEGLRDMCDRYEQNGTFTDERARDFLSNVRIKCKDAIECVPILDEHHWKPSEEQIATLEQWLKDKQFDGDSRYVYPIFESLYNDLKKLIAKKDRI